MISKKMLPGVRRPSLHLPSSVAASCPWGGSRREERGGERGRQRGGGGGAWGWGGGEAWGEAVCEEGRDGGEEGVEVKEQGHLTSLAEVQGGCVAIGWHGKKHYARQKIKGQMFKCLLQTIMFDLSRHIMKRQCKAVPLKRIFLFDYPKCWFKSKLNHKNK